MRHRIHLGCTVAAAVLGRLGHFAAMEVLMENADSALLLLNQVNTLDMEGLFLFAVGL